MMIPYRYEDVIVFSKEMLADFVLVQQDEIVKLKELYRLELNKEKSFDKHSKEALDKYERISDLAYQITEILEE